MTSDTFDRFTPPDRGLFGDNEHAPRGCVTGASDLVDVDLILHNDNPTKQAIAVSLQGNTPFERWAWLPRSLIEYELRGIGVNGSRLVTVTMPEHIAKNRGLL